MAHGQNTYRSKMVRNTKVDLKYSFKSDWIASDTIFFNEKQKEVSRNILDIINFDKFEWDLDGLSNYLDFGYSVFGRTPVKGLRFIRPNSRIIWNESCQKYEEFLCGDKEKLLLNSITDQKSNVKNTVDLITSKVNAWESKYKDEIILLPLSGGYDSRFLLSCIQDRSRVRAFTYGLSDDQSQSFEVLNAKKIISITGTTWDHVVLGNFHRYLDDWYHLYGPSTHAHGMYHFEFYHKIQSLLGEKYDKTPMLSGLMGDSFSGKASFEEVNNPDEVVNLSRNKHYRSSSMHLKCKNHKNKYLEEYFEEKKIYLKNNVIRTLESARFKITLLNYLIRVPQLISFTPYSPFLEQDVGVSMLTLPESERQMRKWQSNYFQKIGFNILEEWEKESFKNTLGTQAMYTTPLKPLNKKILKEIINEDYIDWINKNLLHSWSSRTRKKIANSFYDTNYFRGKYRLKRFFPIDEHRKAYAGYLTLYPLQKLILQRDYFLKNKVKT